MCLRDGGALRSLGRQQSRATRRDQRAPVLNMFPPSDIHDRRRPSIKIWVDGLFGSSCPILGHLVRDRRAPPSRRRTDHDRSERTSPVPSSTSVVDARHPPPQMTMANSRAISCRFISRWFRRQYRWAGASPQPWFLVQAPVGPFASPWIRMWGRAGGTLCLCVPWWRGCSAVSEGSAAALLLAAESAEGLLARVDQHVHV